MKRRNKARSSSVICTTLGRSKWAKAVNIPSLDARTTSTDGALFCDRASPGSETPREIGDADVVVLAVAVRSIILNRDSLKGRSRHLSMMRFTTSIDDDEEGNDVDEGKRIGMITPERST